MTSEWDSKDAVGGESTSFGKPETGEEEKDELVLLKEQLEEQTAKAEENYDLYMRALADGENQRKRWQKDKDDLLRFGNMALLRKMLPMADDFVRARQAIEQGGDMASFQKGVEMIEKRLIEVFEKEGVEMIPALNQEFDPNFHEAFSVDESGDKPDGTIVQEMQTGYAYNDRVLRPSLVVVA
ncbi:MAG: nucleotide exchange factor GrpE, partial [Syntrophomonadaceae bacterium]|nr:nucleotide exchange factor GrpE [Syntrophomonadaceae bacterium]